MHIAHAYATQIRFDFAPKSNGIDGIGNIEWANWAEKKINIPAKYRHKKAQNIQVFFRNSINVLIIIVYILFVNVELKYITNEATRIEDDYKKKREKKSTHKMSNKKRDSSIGRAYQRGQPKWKTEKYQINIIKNQWLTKNVWVCLCVSEFQSDANRNMMLECWAVGRLGTYIVCNNKNNGFICTMNKCY